ncbi:granulocyte-macrophage colony-stimulating factor receptor subunit alpha, partial [Octodon degus]|uniref:Granulocyte-macrophage colony-stimulating factor receptor subunit alpha n=1 Tax=Octodon degus TaxID=10160 RepID=A0A6P6DRJ4_OCTDE
MPQGPRPVGSPERVLPAPPPPLLLLLLLPALGLGLAGALSAEQKDPEPSLRLNVTFNASSRTLSWDCLENATHHLYIYDAMDSPAVLNVRGACSCVLKYHLLHKGATFEVHAIVQDRLFRGALQVSNPGPEGSGAQNLTCFIYDASYMNCTWARGPAAPRDTQYFLFIANTRTHRQRECPLYTEDAAGTHTGCHVRDLSGLSFSNYFLVNGTSAETPIQFFDALWSIKRIEWMSPPGNVTVRCNTNHCNVTWTRPRTKTLLTPRDFQYQLDIQSRVSGRARPREGRPRRTWVCRAGSSGAAEGEGGGRRTLGTTPGPRRDPRPASGPGLHRLPPSPSAVTPARSSCQTAPRHPCTPAPLGLVGAAAGSDAQDSRALSLYVPVVLSTLVCALVLGFLFKRFLGVRGLCPRVPRVKDKLSELD